MGNYRIAVLPGDGIGKEVTSGAVEVLKAVGIRFGHEFAFEYGLIGGVAIDEAGTPLPEETLRLCQQSDAVLLGAVGGPKWDDNPPHLRPEKDCLPFASSSTYMPTCGRLFAMTVWFPLRR